jgi:hypothetical protein
MWCFLVIYPWRTYGKVVWKYGPGCPWKSDLAASIFHIKGWFTVGLQQKSCLFQHQIMDKPFSWWSIRFCFGTWRDTLCHPILVLFTEPDPRRVHKYG